MFSNWRDKKMTNGHWRQKQDTHGPHAHLNNNCISFEISKYKVLLIYCKNNKNAQDFKVHKNNKNKAFFEPLLGHSSFISLNSTLSVMFA